MDAGDGLPWPGGFLSWPAYHYTHFRWARVIRGVLTAYAEAENPVTWTNDNPEQFKIIAFIERLRRQR